ncbi:C40 family peptidase [Fusicatenibacter saccharivorans]|uniref:C40 family peptidase n=1 Tax=Fusicatenibacter saccharivorans TaxID=1150298 RepID=UPI00156EBC59|nr:C40 family peptidase [Fusicatenibacter saccharivorans]NSD24545.1 C40 family peptidase [Fusicatenibacter saccharivorans]NSD80926.1 C40 family peptidase [Fusicatenibacter saccharivorans]
MQEWKASEKEAQKMTRDGAISVNLVTGEATHISDRPPEQDYSSADDTAETSGRVVDEMEGHVERRQAKKARHKRRDTFREGEAARDLPSSRLQFTEEERAVPELKKAIRKSDKAADKLDAAKAAVPLKPPGKEHGNPLSRPVQELKSTIHGEVSKVEGENSGVQAGHLGERQIEKAVGYGGRRFHQARADRKLKPWRDVSKAEQAAVKANADFYWQKSVMENPQLASSNPISRLWQKKRLQKQYAAAHRAGTGAAQAAGKASQTAASAAKKGGGTIAQKLGGFVTKNKHTLLIVGGIGLILMLIMGLMQSCTSMFGGGTSGLVASSYLSEDSDLTGAEAAYCEMEAELQEYLDTYEATHDYDEYHFDLDEIEHDPYVLLSILSALHEGVFTLDEVQGDLEMLFDKQYILTETVTTETRYRTETRTDSEGNEYEVEVPYTWYICTVTLENFDLSHVPVYIMGEDQLSMYAVYMSTLGNRPDLFPSSGYVGKYIENPPTAWDIPAEYLTDERFATLITEAEKYLGYPYVWGGSSPETSFDCSGFVSYVLTNTGLCNTGRLGAQGLYNISTRVSDPQPGDLVFFVGTYDTSGISHVGIYVGDNMMLHCGDPISYTNLNTSYWQSHFYAYGRPPYN